MFIKLNVIEKVFLLPGTEPGFLALTDSVTKAGEIAYTK